MRNSFPLILTATLVVASGAVLADNAPITAPSSRAAAVAPAAPPAPPIGNNTAYEQAITAYLENVVKEAKDKEPQSAQQRPAQAAPPAPIDEHYDTSGFIRRGHEESTLPRVERITIGLTSRAQLETPDGGMLRVSPGDRTPLGTVTAIRASGVWFKPVHSNEVVELADIAPDDDNSRGSKIPISAAPPAIAPSQIPVPPNVATAPASH